MNQLFCLCTLLVSIVLLVSVDLHSVNARQNIAPVISMLLNAPDTCTQESLNPLETFEESDQPYTIPINRTSYSVSTPWGYDKIENGKRFYPIVINGYWNEGGYFTSAIRKKYPAFYLTYQKDGEADGEALAAIINSAITQDIRIDQNRIYLTGFSRGGSGSYKLIKGFEKGNRVFASLIRVAGQSQTVLIDEAVAQTAIWYHIGDLDTPTRVQVALDAYDFVKKHTFNSTAVESVVEDTLAGYPRTTSTLTRNGTEIMKLSYYKGMGHTPHYVYTDPEIFKWFFSHSLHCN